MANLRDVLSQLRSEFETVDIFRALAESAIRSGGYGDKHDPEPLARAVLAVPSTSTLPALRVRQDGADFYSACGGKLYTYSARVRDGDISAAENAREAFLNWASDHRYGQRVTWMRPTDPSEPHTPAPRTVPPLGSPLPTCAVCGTVYMADDDDAE